MENMKKFVEENSQELEKEKEKSFVERIEKLDFWDDQRTNLILSWKGLKPANDFIIGFKYPARSDTELESLCVQTEELFSDLGLLYVRNNNFQHDDEGMRNYFIAKNKENLTAIQNSDYEKRANAEQTGRLLGFPQTAIEAYIQGDEFLMRTEDFPTGIRREEYMAFLSFRLSKAHWQDEIFIIKKWAEEIKNTDLVLYNREVKEYKLKNSELFGAEIEAEVAQKRERDTRTGSH